MPAENDIIEYCCYKDNSNLCTVYDGLYQWDEMMNYIVTGSSQNISPIGWHISAKQEFYNLQNFLGGKYVAGGKLKETGTAHWNANNVGATNETGFTALPGGELKSWDPVYDLLGFTGWFWSSSPGIDGGSHFYLALTSGSESVLRSDDPFGSSYYVRCIRD